MQVPCCSSTQSTYAGNLHSLALIVRRLRMDGWVEKKNRKKTGRNRGPDEVLDVDEMLDEIDAEDPPDYDEIERLLESPEPEGPCFR